MENGREERGYMKRLGIDGWMDGWMDGLMDREGMGLAYRNGRTAFCFICRSFEWLA
jgi:hypothetical protein